MGDIKLNRDGFAFLEMDIRPANLPTMETVLYKVDTGANCTTISFQQLLKLGYDEDWVKSGKAARPTVASGFPVDDCYEVILPEIHIGDWVGYNWPVTTSLSVPFKFLLGTDSMQFFNWYFDYENGLCKFDLIQGKRKVLFNQKEQSIHAIDDVEQNRRNQAKAFEE
ncbi:MAG: hypothetical protein FWF81_13020 [Defluviitaleaceae bacterium]|nr:hypothetical protein [Defluviitaleaceae bacterium]